MKKFITMLLVFLMLIGSFASYADDIDILDDIEIETGDIEEPIEEIEINLADEVLEDIDLAEQELLAGEETDIYAFEGQESIIAYDVQSNEIAPYEDDDNSSITANTVTETFVTHLYTRENIDILCQNYSYINNWYWKYDSTVQGTSSAYTGIQLDDKQLQDNRYKGYEYGGGSQCYAFVAYIGARLSGLPNGGTPYYDESTWDHYSIAQIKSLGGFRIGDIIEIRTNSGSPLHWAMVYGIRDDGYIETIQAFGSDNNKIKIGMHFSSAENRAGVNKYFSNFEERAKTRKVTVHRDRNAKVPCPIESIELSPKKVTINKSNNETVALKAKISPTDATNQKLLWSSDDPSIATVTADGLIQPVAVGETVIICAAQDGSGQTASCTVTVTSFILNKDKLDMYIGQTFTLEGKVGKAKVTCSFKSSNPKVVSVDKKGKITAKNVKKGTKVTITATAPKKQGTATCVVTVHPKPTKLTIKQGKAKTLNIGDTLDLSVEYTPKDALGKVVWSSSHKKVATVSSSGKVKAVGEGVATIEAEVTGVGSGAASIKITVTDPYKPTSISISAPSKTVRMGETLQLTAALKPKTAQSDVSWKSSNTKIAKVSKKGVVTPVKTGKVTITATAAKKSPKGKTLSAKIEITVKKSNAPTSISVGTKKKTMYPGEKWSLDYKIKPTDAKATLTFSSSDADVASVSKKGVVKALKKGTATITVKTQNNLTAICKVTVKSKPTIQLDKENLSLNVGDQYNMTVIVSGGTSGKKFSFSSSNTRVATVDKNAIITAVGVGEAVITVTMDNDDVATCNVTVNAPNTVTTFSIEEPDTITLKVGDTYKINTAIEPESAHPDILWSISKDGILDEWWTAYACISSDGTITALKEGEKTIYARIKREGMDDLERSVHLKIIPSGSNKQLYTDGVLLVLGVINNHREESEVPMVTIDKSLCEMASQQLEHILNEEGNSIPDSYSWILHSDLPYSADDIWLSLNMEIEFNQKAKEICINRAVKSIGIAVQSVDPWWGYTLAILK